MSSRLSGIHASPEALILSSVKRRASALGALLASGRTKSAAAPLKFRMKARLFPSGEYVQWRSPPYTPTFG